MEDGHSMVIGDYFGMIINILIVLTFIAFALAFLYMIYGEKEEHTQPPKTKESLSKDPKHPSA
jgi:uncharacterized membrane protein